MGSRATAFLSRITYALAVFDNVGWGDLGRCLMTTQRSLVRRGLVGLAALPLLAAVSSDAGAQNAKPQDLLVLQEVQRTDMGFRYEYMLVHFGARTDLLADVLIDLSSPGTDEKPTILYTSGAFLFDALAEDSALASHPPVGITSPPRWSAAVYHTGEVSWGASRYSDGTNYSLRPGYTLQGFALESPALPALRRYKVLPYRPFPTVPQLPRSGDDAIAERDVYAGYVLAPGWMPNQVTVPYLAEQTRVVCMLRLIENCRPFAAVLERMVRAHEQGDRREVYDRLLEFLRLMAMDQTLHPHARLVLQSTAEALRIHV